MPQLMNLDECLENHLRPTKHKATINKICQHMSCMRAIGILYCIYGDWVWCQTPSDQLHWDTMLLWIIFPYFTRIPWLDRIHMFLQAANIFKLISTDKLIVLWCCIWLWCLIFMLYKIVQLYSTDMIYVCKFNDRFLCAHAHKPSPSQTWWGARGSSRGSSASDAGILQKPGPYNDGPCKLRHGNSWAWVHMYIYIYLDMYIRQLLQSDIVWTLEVTFPGLRLSSVWRIKRSLWRSWYVFFEFRIYISLETC